MCQFTHFIHGRRAHGSVQLARLLSMSMTFIERNESYRETVRLHLFHINIEFCVSTLTNHKCYLKGLDSFSSFSILLGAGERPKAGLQV